MEAEEFQPAGDAWRARPWGENYYAATFANSFLSRKAFLGADDVSLRLLRSCEPTDYESKGGEGDAQEFVHALHLIAGVLEPYTAVRLNRNVCFASTCAYARWPSSERAGL